jgi:hypothetical protein
MISIRKITPTLTLVRWTNERAVLAAKLPKNIVRTARIAIRG